MTGEAGQRGRFWIPNAREKALSGALRFGPPLGGTLVLDDELLASREAQPVIHGVLFGGQRLTALDCYPAGTDCYYGEDGRQQQQTIVAQTFVLDAHVELNTRFDRAGAVISYLDDWADMGKGWSLGDLDDAKGSIAYDGRTARTATLEDGRVVTLKVGPIAEGSSRRLVAKQGASFVVDFRHPATILDVAQAAGSLQDLLTFVARRPATIQELEVTSPSVRDSHSGAPRVLTIRSEQVTDTPANPPFLSTWEFLFMAPGSDEGFSELMGHWFALELRLGTALDVFLGQRYAPPKHLELQVMAMCQSAEGYHRRMWDGKVMSAEDKENLRASLTEACPAAWRQMLDSWLEHVDEPSFKKRIEEIIVKAGPIGERVTSRFSNFPGKLRDYRHQYAHWLSGKVTTDEKVVMLNDLYDATRILLEACILQDIGLGMDATVRAFETRRDFRRLTEAL